MIVYAFSEKNQKSAENIKNENKKMTPLENSPRIQQITTQQPRSNVQRRLFDSDSEDNSTQVVGKRTFEEFDNQAQQLPLNSFPKRVFSKNKIPRILGQKMEILGKAYKLEELGQGNTQKVWKIVDSSSTISVPTVNGSIDIFPEQVVLKNFRPDKLVGPSLKKERQRNKKAFTEIESNFQQIFGREAPLAKKIIAFNDWDDKTNPRNGIDVWERYLPINKNDANLLEDFWTFGKQILHKSIEFGLSNGKEFVGDFHPNNVMRKMGSTNEFVIVDASPSEDDEWIKRLNFYIREWCKFCGKNINDMTADWSTEQKQAIDLS